MFFAWPTLEQATYRVMRLRRLIGVAVIVPMAVIFWVTISDPTVLAASHASIAIIGIAALVVTHAAFFPNGALETLALSFATTLLVLTMPLLKALSLWAPIGQEAGVLVLLYGFAVVATGVLSAIIQIILNALIYFGPVWRKTLESEIVVNCSPKVAFQQFALRPDLRRGKVLTGPVDENGFFNVAVAMPETADDCRDIEENIVRLDAKILQSTPERHDVMMVMDNGAIAVNSQKFFVHSNGCMVKVSDLPGDFTVGMHLLFWLTDQQADNLTETADMVMGHDERANNAAHHVSLLTVAGAVLSPRPPVSDRAE